MAFRSITLDTLELPKRDPLREPMKVMHGFIRAFFNQYLPEQAQKIGIKGSNAVLHDGALKYGFDIDLSRLREDTKGFDVTAQSLHAKSGGDCTFVDSELRRSYFYFANETSLQDAIKMLRQNEGGLFPPAK